MSCNACFKNISLESDKNVDNYVRIFDQKCVMGCDSKVISSSIRSKMDNEMGL